MQTRYTTNFTNLIDIILDKKSFFHDLFVGTNQQRKWAQLMEPNAKEWRQPEGTNNIRRSRFAQKPLFLPITK